MGSDTIWMKIWDQIPRFNELLEEYNNMLHRLEHECQDEKTTNYTDMYNMIIKIINHVVKSRTVRERIVNMNGRILELQSEKLIRQGIEKANVQNISNLMENAKKTFEEACALLGIDENDFAKYKNML